MYQEGVADKQRETTLNVKTVMNTGRAFIIPHIDHLLSQDLPTQQIYLYKV